jgi:tetratricopeptide (TPR) repeat protein
MKRTRQFLLFLLPFLIGASIAVGQKYPLSANVWDNPEFVERFMGSYGVDNKTEPQVSQTESELMQQLVEVIKTDVDMAIEQLRAAITPESSPALHYVLGNLYLESQRFGQAEAAYRTAIKEFPQFLRAYKNLGLSLIQQEELEEAVPFLVKAIELGDGSGNTYGLLGYCYLNQGNMQSALEAYRTATLLSPENNDWKLGKAQTLMELQLYREAIGLLRELIKESPGKSTLWVILSNAHLESGEPEKAAQFLEVLRRMDKADVPSLVLLGDIYMNEGLPALALNGYIGALEKTEEPEASLVLRIARTLASRGAFDEAREYTEALRDRLEATDTEIEEKDLLTVEAEVALGLGQREQAAGILQDVLEEDPLNRDALSLLGEYYYNRQQYAEAEYYFERLAGIRDARPEALVQLGRLKVAMGELQEAVEHLREAQMLEPRPNVRRYLEAVERAYESRR